MSLSESMPMNFARSRDVPFCSDLSKWRDYKGYSPPRGGSESRPNLAPAGSAL
jgi:hypothetical protein